MLDTGSAASRVVCRPPPAPRATFPNVSRRCARPSIGATSCWTYRTVPSSRGFRCSWAVFTLDAAQAARALDETGGADLLTSLESLVDKSRSCTATRALSRTGSTCSYTVIREYARDALADRSEDERIEEQARRRLFPRSCRESVGQAPEPRAGGSGWRRLRAERDDLRSAMGGLCVTRLVPHDLAGIGPQAAWRAQWPAALRIFWFADGALVEGRRWPRRPPDLPQGTGQAHDWIELAQATVVAAARLAMFNPKTTAPRPG